MRKARPTFGFKEDKADPGAGTLQGSPWWEERQVGEARVDRHKGFQKEINMVCVLVSSDINFVVLFALVVEFEF